jgi:hypothetical protein
MAIGDLSYHFLQNSMAVIAFTIIIGGPLPLGLFAVLTLFKTGTDLLEIALLTLLGWITISTLLALLVGIAGALKLFPLLIINGLLLVFGIYLLFRKTQVDSINSSQSMQFTKPDRMLVTLFVLVGIYISWTLITQPARDFDSLYYHLPNMVKWYQTGTLERIPGIGQMSFYPYNWELLATLFIIPFKSDLLITFINLVAWFLAGLSVYLIGVELFGKGTFAVLAAFCLMIMPIIINYINTLTVDLAVGAIFLAGLYLILRFHKTHSPAYLGFLIILSGLLLGIKMSGVGFSVLLAVSLIFLEIYEFIERKHFSFPHLSNVKNETLILLVCTLVAVFVGGYWYFQNTVEIGNPLGFVQVNIGPIQIFKGNEDFYLYLQNIYPNIADIQHLLRDVYREIHTFDDFAWKGTLANLFDYRNLNDWKVLLIQLLLAGGLPFLLLSFGAMLVATPTFLYIAKRNGKKNFVLLLLLLSGTGILFWNTPYSADNGGYGWQITPFVGQAFRYAIPFFGVLAIYAQAGYSVLASRPFLTGLLGVLCLLFVSIYPRLLSQSTQLIFLTIFLLVWLVEKMRIPIRLPTRIQLNAPSIYVGIAIFFIFGTFIGQTLKDREWATDYGPIVEFMETSFEPDDRVGIALTFRPYPLYGRRLDNQIVYIPAATNATLDEWLDSLRENNIRAVVFGPTGDEHWIKTRELKWLESRKDSFTKIFGEDATRDYLIYRFIPEHR